MTATLAKYRRFLSATPFAALFFVFAFLSLAAAAAPAATTDFPAYSNDCSRFVYTPLKEDALKSMVNGGKCILLALDEIPNFDLKYLADCYYKDYGVSCSSVNRDCEYVEARIEECREGREGCEYASDYWNRPMKTGARPILYSFIRAPRDVIVQNADQEHTSLKPIKDKLKFTHEDKEVWWREVYYIANARDLNSDIPFTMTKLITREGYDDWIRGEIGQMGADACRYEVRLGFYVTMKPVAQQVNEAEWAVPIQRSSPEKWRQR